MGSFCLIAAPNISRRGAARGHPVHLQLAVTVGCPLEVWYVRGPGAHPDCDLSAQSEYPVDLSSSGNPARPHRSGTIFVRRRFWRRPQGAGDEETALGLEAGVVGSLHAFFKS